MTDSEIIKNWRNSNQDAAQIQVLADLNAVTVPAMVKRLRGLGLDVSVPTPPAPQPRRRGLRAQPPTPIEFECPPSCEPLEAMTLDQLVAVLGRIAKKHPGSTVSMGRRGDPITRVALLSQFGAADDNDGQHADVRLV